VQAGQAEPLLITALGERTGSDAVGGEMEPSLPPLLRSRSRTLTDVATEPARVDDPQSADGRVLTARGQRTRERLVRAAYEVFQRVPFAEAKITDITSEAGVAAGTFYTYFDSKETIFREVAKEALADMSRSSRRDPDNVEGDPIRDIAYASRQYFLGCLRNAGIARSIEQLTVGDRSLAENRHSTLVHGVKRAERWIRDLQERGICDRGIDPWTTAMVLHTMNVRVAYDHLLLSGRESDVDGLVEAVTHVWARTCGLERVPTPENP
jgi:AcrR family transcriptional regulator